MNTIDSIAITPGYVVIAGIEWSHTKDRFVQLNEPNQSDRTRTTARAQAAYICLFDVNFTWLTSAGTSGNG